MQVPFIGQLEPRRLLAHFLAHPPLGSEAECLAAGTPAFTLPFDVLTTASAGIRRRVERWPLPRLWRRWLRIRARFIGSTVGEYAWLPQVDPATLARVLRDGQARRSPLLVIKDLPRASPLLDAGQNAWAEAFTSACEALGFVLLEGQALAWVPIDFDSTDAYIANLSRGRRRDVRRKLRSRAKLDVEIVATGAAFCDDALVDELYAMFNDVYAQSEVHFDLPSHEFFAAVLRDAEAAGTVFLYRCAGRLLGWNLCFEHDGALIDKYMGLRYPDARDHNLYAVSWIENLDYARRRGLRHYVAGWTDAEVKAHLGANFTFTRHAVYPRNRLVRYALRRFARHFETDRAWHEATRCDP